MKKKHATKQPASYTDSEFFFDDCPVCQAMKKAEKHGRSLSESDLKEAFRQAKDKGAVVGGSLVDLPDTTN